MSFSESKYYVLVEDIVLTKHSTLYLCENFMINEMYEGVDFRWHSFKKLMKKAIKHYGKNKSVHLISNNINEHSIDPLLWLRVLKHEVNINIETYTIVTKSKSSQMSAHIEKFFLHNEIPTFIYGSLQEAINLVELKVSV